MSYPIGKIQSHVYEKFDFSFSLSRSFHIFTSAIQEKTWKRSNKTKRNLLNDNTDPSSSF